MSEALGPERARATPEMIGAMVIVVAACARASAGFSPLPGWESSPMEFVAPESSWTPTISLGLDVVTLAGAALSGFGCGLRAWWSAGVLLGGLAIMARALLGGSIDDVVIGCNWLAGVAGMVALMRACVSRQVRGVAMGALAGFLIVLVGKGSLQVLVEQPATMEMFKQSKQAFFASRGWSADSPLARGFERRLMQPEATGWFGLANVFATFVAAGFVLGLGVTMHAWRQAGKAKLAGLALLVASAIGLVQCGSKGGFVVAALGTLLTLAAAGWHRRGMCEQFTTYGLRRIGNIVGLMAVVGVIAGVVMRGMMGERLRELSLLFRWFYMQGAARIFGEHPWLGVGPAGFQEAYMLAKPALSPEDVNSPHSVLWDWAATLGVGGVAWGAMLVFVALRLGRALVGEQGHGSDATESLGRTGSQVQAESLPPGLGVKLVFLVAALATLFGAWCERGVVTPEGAALRVGGLLAWTIVGGALAGWWLRAGVGPRVANAAAMLAAIAHLQMDVTAVQVTSGPLVLAMLGVAAAPVVVSSAERAARNAWIGRLVAVLAMGLPVAGVVRVVPWENALREAANTAREVGELRMRRAEVERAGTSEKLREFALDLERLGVGVVVGPDVVSREQIDRAMTGFAQQRGEAACRLLAVAAQREPAHVGTVSTLGQLQLQVYEASLRTAFDNFGWATELRDAAVDAAARLTSLRPRSVNAWQWRASAEGAAYQIGPDREPSRLVTMVEAYRRCTELAPHSLAARVGLVETLERLGQGDEVRKAAAACLEVDDSLRLDPLIRLTEAQRRRMEGLARP